MAKFTWVAPEKAIIKVKKIALDENRTAADVLIDALSLYQLIKSQDFKKYASDIVQLRKMYEERIESEVSGRT